MKNNCTGLLKANILFQLVESVRHGAYNFDIQFLAHFRNVVIADTREGLRIFFKRQARCVPLLEQHRQLLCGLSSNNEKSGVQTTKALVEILETLEKKPGKYKWSVTWRHFNGGPVARGKVDVSQGCALEKRQRRKSRIKSFIFVGSQVTLHATLPAFPLFFSLHFNRFIKYLP